jgi:hypothetical protein
MTGRKTGTLAGWLLAILPAAPAKAPRVAVPVRVHLQRTCSRCHGLNVVRAQRLSRSEWEQELEKMARMGARIHSREILLDYLTQHYGPVSSTR